DAEDLDRAGGRPRDAVDHAQRGRLARAVRAEQPEADAGRHVEVEVAHGDARAEALGHAARADHGLAGRRHRTDESRRARRFRRRVARAFCQNAALGRTAMKLGLALEWAGAQLAVPVARVQLAERLGFDSVWSAEAYGSDAFTPLAFLAAHT